MGYATYSFGLTSVRFCKVSPSGHASTLICNERLPWPSRDPTRNGSTVRILKGVSFQDYLPPKDLIVEIYRRNVRLKVSDDDYSVNWFRRNFAAGWEEDLLVLLENILKPERDFIDIGAWIGPISLFAATKARRVLSIEPDPTARHRLERNIASNSALSNITVSPNALYSRNALIRCGGNGPLGNSESTILVNDPNYITASTAVPHYVDDQTTWRSSAAVQVEANTLSTICLENGFSLLEVAAVKLDIEGGEKFVIDKLLTDLAGSPAVLILSLHWCYLSTGDAERIVHQTFRSYKYAFNVVGRVPLCAEEAIRNRVSEIYFCNE